MNDAETRVEHIGPCGYTGLRVTQACKLGITVPINELQAELAQNLIHGLQHHFLMKAHTHPPRSPLVRGKPTSSPDKGRPGGV